MDLDQYYTKPKVAERCFKRLLRILPHAARKNFIEPSAGNGSFLFLLPRKRRVGLDIDPQVKEIQRKNFFEWRPKAKKSSEHVIIGNPPFGHRARLAIAFFNHATLMADTIAFIVPRQFQKYSVHSKLHKDFKLISDEELAEDSFHTLDGEDFRVRCVFQIWTREETKHRNLRLLKPPPIRHEDFEMYQYNNTPEALKVFRLKWDFAVPRQGYQDYNRREKYAKDCEKHKQWILFKPKNKEVRERLLRLDFSTLAKKNTAIYGFGKADVVMEYNKIFHDR